MKILIALLFAAMIARSAEAADLQPFAVGQMWSIKDSGMQIVFGRIDPYPGGKTAISISVFNVPCPPEAGCTTTTLAHTPFDEDSLAKSVDKLMAAKASVAPQFEEGYANWRQAEGGVYTIPVPQLPQLIFKTIEHGVKK